VSSRVLYLGLDACDPDLARRLATTGHMPALASLLADGAHAKVDNPYGFLVGAVWPAVWTGLPPTRTGYYCWDEIAAGTYEWHETTPTSLRGRPFWEALSDAGRHVALVDIPHAWASTALDGVQLVEYGCHDRHFGLSSWPPELARDVVGRHGHHDALGISDPWTARQFAPDDYVFRAGRYRTAAENRQLLHGLVAGARRKQAVTTELLGGRDWDLFAAVFGESHAVGHQLWHLHDATHPRHDPAEAATLGDPVLAVYRALDGVVARHLELVDEDTTVVVHLSHGMGPHYDGTHLLDVLLWRLGRRAGADRGARSPGDRVLGALGRRSMPVTARALRAAARGRDGAGAEPTWEYDLADRPFFNAPNNTVWGGVRVNLAGREPAGIVAPEDFDRVCDALADDLRAVVNVDTGEPAVDAVTRTDTIYRREPPDALPDLLVEWRRSAPIETVWSPRTGLVHRPYEHHRTGDHRLDGLLVARGPAVAGRGRRPDVSVYDVAPTLCGALGVPFHPGAGRPVPWLGVPALATARATGGR
jgi:predicted AlkP superfamily phosphohydrolase/phosphomutase